eukprot:8769503-Karenia_brevis.AAC.1
MRSMPEVNKAAPAAPKIFRKQRVSSKSKGWGKLIEFCINKNSNSSKASKSFDGVRVFEITKDDDAHKPATIKWVSRIIDQYPGISIH